MFPDWPAIGDDANTLDPFPTLELSFDLHEEARSLASRTRQVCDAFEAAVLLGTRGYTDERARELGCRDVFELARRLMPLLPLFDGPPGQPPVGVIPRAPEPPVGPERLSAGLLLRSLLYSAPWLVAIAALVISRVSFWSTITTEQFSSAISLGLFVALVVTGAFIQAFARRGAFYSSQHDEALMWWTSRLTLGAGAVALAVAIAVGYVVLEVLSQAYTPAATRSFVYFGFSIGVLLLAFAPLFLGKALWEVLGASVAGGLVAIIGGRLVTHGNYINPYTAQHVQLCALWTATIVAGTLDVWVMTRMSGKAEAPPPISRPHIGAVLRAVGGYATYGAGFFALIIADHLITGGLWRGSFHYDGHYELAIGVALLVLVPTLTYGTAASELLPRLVQRELGHYVVGGSEAFCARLSSFYRRHLGITAGIGVLTAIALFAAGHWLSAASSVTAGLDKVDGLFAGALVAYVLLSIAALNSGLLFSLSRPRIPAVASWAGTALSLAVGTALARTWSPQPGALVGLLSGVTLFAAATTLAADRAFKNFDLSYYQAF